ncbi:MAG: adenosylcobinamide-GDP ribazoletransferase [Candidatus Omnitrophota bacterium]
MNKILLALQCLTIIPVRIKNVKNRDLAGSVAYFPFIGFLLGCALAGAVNLGRHINFPDIGLSAIIVILLAILTGGMHLDGLADLFDALGSRKNREEMLAIMRDSHIGSMGVIAIAGAMILKTTLLLAAGTPLQAGSLIIMCVISRWAMVFLMYRFPYARREGKAKIYLDGINAHIFSIATAFTLAISFLVGQMQGIIVLGIAALFVYLTGKYLAKKLGGITGDAIGATNEITEIVCLFIMCL